MIALNSRRDYLHSIKSSKQRNKADENSKKEKRVNPKNKKKTYTPINKLLVFLPLTLRIFLRLKWAKKSSRTVTANFLEM